MSGLWHGDAEVQRIVLGTSSQAQSMWLGDTQVWPPAGREETIVISTAGTQNVTLPWWTQYCDIVVLGAGGSGSGGDLISDAECWGGGSGLWNSGRYTLTPGARVVSVTVGAGGAQAKVAEGGKAGGTTTVAAGSFNLSAGGGAAGSGYGPAVGRSPGTYSMFARDFVGGAEAPRAGNANPPGGGGGAASGGRLNRHLGGPGAPGCVWLICRSD